MVSVNAARPAQGGSWPALPLEQWNPTRDTLHRWLQIVGKTRLALAPPVNHWWHVTLYLTARGLTTSPMPYGSGSFEVEFDFVAHELRILVSDGSEAGLPLRPQSVARFYQEYTRLLDTLGLPVRLRPVPSEMDDELPFPEDEQHHSYESDQARRCWEILAVAHGVLQRFRGQFIGKCSPVHLFWGAFDLACTRFSGRRAPVHPGGVPHLPDRVVREAYSHECMSVGWWPGTPGGPVAQPAFYAYAYPEPAGYGQAGVGPTPAYYNADLREFILPYEAVRSASRPDDLLMQFLQSTYDAAADLGEWDRAALERT
jgi:Family of unknown function (DUF5996)